MYNIQEVRKSLKELLLTTEIKRRWRYYDAVDASINIKVMCLTDRFRDEIHVVVVDEDGITGTMTNIIKHFQNYQNADALTPQGDSNYLPTVIRNQSKHVYWVDSNAAINCSSTLQLHLHQLHTNTVLHFQKLMVQQLQMDNFRTLMRSSKTLKQLMLV